MHAKYAYGLCRTVTGHSWTYRPEEFVKHWKHPGYAFVFQCTRCDTTKNVWYSPRGAVLGTQYTYPDGYKTKADRSSIRRTALAELKGKHA